MPTTLAKFQTLTANLPALGSCTDWRAYNWGPGTFKVQAVGVDAAFIVTEAPDGFAVDWKAWPPQGGNVRAGTKAGTLEQARAWIAKTINLDGFLFE